MLAIRPRKASNKWEDRKWQHPARELAVWESLRLMTSPARPWGGASGRSNAGSAPERIRSSDPPSATPAKSRSRWQRERWVALRPVLASWTCFSLSGSAGRPALSSGMNLRGWGGLRGAGEGGGGGVRGAALGSWVRGASRNFLGGGAAALSSFPSPGSFTPRWLPRATCGLSRPEQGCLGEAVMRGLWEKTGPERTGNAVEARQGSARPWEVGVLEPREGTQSRPENHKPMICPSAPLQPLLSCARLQQY